MIPFISRHVPTAAQQATVYTRWGSLVCPDPVVFEPSRVCHQVLDAVDHLIEQVPTTETMRYDVVSGVFPSWALIELLKGGMRVIEFVNEPSARARGVFVCRGAYEHHATIRHESYGDEAILEASEFLPCPIPVSEQEDSPLLGGLRKE